MRFCLDLTHHPWARADDPVAAAAKTIALAAAADAGGIDAIWVSEDPEGWDAFALLGALAAVTTRAELGTGVTSPFPRHPNLLAAAVATLDRLSGGRAVLGLGRGQPEWWGGPLGVNTGSPLAALEATIELCRAWWEAPFRASSTRVGSPFRVVDWERVIGPVRRPPIYLAAAGPEALALAGRLAEGVIFNALTSEAVLTEVIPDVRGAAHRAGRDQANLAFVLRTAVKITDDPRLYLEQQKNLFALINALPGMDRLVRVPGYDGPAIMAEVRRAMRSDVGLAAGGFPGLRRVADLEAARAAIPDGLIARLAIVGPLPEVRSRIARLAEIGVTHLSVAAPVAGTAEAFRQLVEDLGG